MSKNYNDWPDADFAHQNVFGSKKDPGWLSCDFSDLDVIIDEEVFFVVFDWLPKFEDPSVTEVAPLFEFHNFIDTEVYMRRQALGQWEKLSLNLSYGLKVEY